jgi:penicillin-binding protein 1A
MGFGMVSGIIANTPDIETIDVSPTKFATKIYDNQGNEIETLISEGSNRVYVSLDQIPETLQHAFIAVEDERFYTHNGIDLRGIARAASVAVKNMGLSEGASTITQQLIKNTVFNAYNESTLEKIERKIQEQYLAVRLDSEMGKDAILENYLNIINLGNGNLGVQAAANNYFNKDVSELTLSECAVIAGITKNPVGYNPINHPDDNRERQLEVLNHMREQNYITQAEYDEAVNDDVYSRIQDIHVESTGNSVYSYFTDALIDSLIDDLKTQLGYTENQATNLIYSGGLAIYSTQDTQMQKIADDILNDPDNYPDNTSVSISLDLTVVDSAGKKRYLTHYSLLNYYQKDLGYTNYSLLFSNAEEAREAVDAYEESLEDSGYTVEYEALYYTLQPQISFSLMDQKTGEVKVIVGGRGTKETSRSMNRATNTYRSPGSTIKPLVDYGPALDAGGLTLATVFDDCPYYYKSSGQIVTNWNKKYKGLMTMRTALKLSENVPAVKCLAQITPSLGFSYLQQFGLSTLVSPNEAINGVHDVTEALAIGGMTLGVYNIDMCAAYATYANDGVYTKPIYYTKVYDHSGNLLIDNTNLDTHRVVKSTTAWLMTSAMQSVVNEGTGTKAKISNQPVAGKTGTSNSDGDLWFVGYTPYYTAAIWTGYDDDSSRAVKVEHTALWSKIMTKIHEDLPTKSFDEQPSDIVEVQVCSQSGMLPAAGLCENDERGSQIITEYFAKGTEPTETCTAHGYYQICGETGKLSVGTCPATTRLMVKRPANGSKAADDYVVDSKVDLTVPDAAYTIPYELADAVCPVHGAWYLEQLGISTGASIDDFSSSENYEDDSGNEDTSNNEDNSGSNEE